MTTPTYPFTDEGVEQALEALGSTPDEIAESLFRLGFQGCINDEVNCPIARYTIASVPEAQQVGVWIDDGEAIVQLDYGFGDDREMVGTTSRLIAQFVRRFDLSYYPDLIEEGR